MDFNSLVSWTGTLTGCLMLAAPIITIRKLAAAGDVGAMTCTYYTLQLLGCVLWISYGSLIGSAAVVVCNVWGGSTGIFCALTYLKTLRLAEAEGKKNPHTSYDHSFRLCGLALMASVLLCILTLSIYSISSSAASSFCGLLAGVVSASLLASPLESVKHIIQTKSADVLSPPTIAMALLNGCIWTFYGLLTLDPFIAVPNGIGVIFTVLLALLLIRYGRSGRPSSPNLGAVRVLSVATETPPASAERDIGTHVVATPTQPDVPPISLALSRSIVDVSGNTSTKDAAIKEA